jgi:uncharacterized membrane protein HdeD (DUF308 family)
MGAGMTALTGLVAIALGILLLAMPGATLQTVIYVFGIMVIVYGLARIVAGLRGRMESKSAGVAGGILAIIAGVAILAWPEMTAATMIWIIGGWAIASGAMDFVGAFTSKVQGTGHKIWAVISGLVSVVFGVLLIVWPGKGGLALLWLIGIYLIVLGFIRIISIFGAAGASLERTGSQGPHPF